MSILLPLNLKNVTMETRSVAMAAVSIVGLLNLGTSVVSLAPPVSKSVQMDNSISSVQLFIYLLLLFLFCEKINLSQKIAGMPQYLYSYGEVCDDSNNNDGDGPSFFFLGNLSQKKTLKIGCSKDCQTIEPGWECPFVGQPCRKICSNGYVNDTAPYTENCDDGNLNNGDGCDSTCHIEPGWKCRTNPPPTVWYFFGQ